MVRLNFRVELLDAVTIPVSPKLQEVQVVTCLANLLDEKWKITYPQMELKALVQGSPNKPVIGANRASLPLWITQQEWLSSSKARLAVAAIIKRALWVRFVIALVSLQSQEYIREAVRLPNGDAKPIEWKAETLEEAQVEFRYLALLLWLQTFRVQSTWHAINDTGPRSSGGRQRSVSDGAIEVPWHPSTATSQFLGGGSHDALARSPRGTRQGAMSPRQCSRDTSLASRLRAALANGSSEDGPPVIDALHRNFPVILALISLHVRQVLKFMGGGTSAHPSSSVIDEKAFSPFLMSAHHLKYLALLLQAQDNSNSDPTFLPSKFLEKYCFGGLQREGLLVETGSTPLIPLLGLATLLRSSYCDINAPPSQLLTSFTLAGATALGLSTLPSRRKDCGARMGGVSPRTGSWDLVELDQASRMPLVAWASPEHLVMVGVRRDVLFPPAAAEGQRASLSIVDCSDCSIYVSNPFVNVKVGSCRNLRVVLPSLTGSLLIYFSKNISAHCAAVGALISNSYDTRLLLLSGTPPVVVGDTRDIGLGPYNIFYDKQHELLKEAGLEFDGHTLQAWCHPIVCPLSANSRALTPRGDDRGGDRDSGGDDSSGGGMMPAPLKPSEVEVLVLPSNGVHSTLRPGDATTGNDEGRSSSPAAAGGRGELGAGGGTSRARPPLVLPEKHVESASQSTLRKQAALMAYLARIETCERAHEKELFLQKTQAKFCEWLQSQKRLSELLLVGQHNIGDTTTTAAGSLGIGGGGNILVTNEFGPSVATSPSPATVASAGGATTPRGGEGRSGDGAGPLTTTITSPPVIGGRTGAISTAVPAATTTEAATGQEIITPMNG